MEHTGQDQQQLQGKQPSSLQIKPLKKDMINLIS